MYTDCENWMAELEIDKFSSFKINNNQLDKN